MEHGKECFTKYIWKSVDSMGINGPLQMCCAEQLGLSGESRHGPGQVVVVGI